MGQASRAGALDRALGWASRRLQTKAGYALVFGLLYAAAWVAPLAVLAVNGKSFFWQVDGISQQYVWFVYTGQWLREVFSNIFVEHTFEVPLWTMDSGFGADTVQSLVCTVVNPFYAVSAFVPEQCAEYAFELSMLACAYCAGLAFSAWCVARGASRSGALAGALVYVFAGNMVTVFSQPGFLFPALAFPLVLWATDRVFAGKGPLPFVAAMAWVFAFSFYDAYMICIMLLLYCLATFFWRVDRDAPRAGRLRRLGGWFVRFLGLLMLAVLVAGVLFLPQAMSLAGSGRLELERADQTLYSANFYLNFLLGFTSYAFAGGDAFTGLSALAPLALVVLVMRRRDNRGLLACFVFLTVALCLPAFGRLMNAMEYATDRWSWAYSLCGAYMVARLLPQMVALGARERRVAGAVLGVYVVACCLAPVTGRVRLEALVLAAALLACLFAARIGRSRAVAVVVLAAAVSGSASFAWYLAPGLGNKASDLVDAGTLWERHSDLNAAGLVEQARENGEDYDETYRYDRTSGRGSSLHNSNLLTGLMAPDLYNSIYNDGIDELLGSLGLTSTEGTNNRYGSLASFASLDALLGVRYYYLSPAESAELLPATFQDARLIAEGETDRYGHRGTAQLYETDRVLPLAFMQTGCLTREEYYALPVEARQEALLAGVVLDAGDVDESWGLEDVGSGLQASVVDVPFEVGEARGCTFDGSTVVVSEYNATLDLAFSSPADAETYLCLLGMDYRDFDAADQYTAQQWDGLGVLGRLAATLVHDALNPRHTNGVIGVKVGDGVRACTVFYPNAEDAIYGGRHDWVCNLGYSEDGKTSVQLSFRETGVYTFEEVRVSALPMEGVLARVDELMEGAATDVAIGCNELSCRVDADEAGLLFLSVAYSDGWTATVDGEPAQIVQADLGFMAVPVGEGAHEVRLTYRTPYLAAGALLSAAGLAGTAVLAVAWRRRHRGADGAAPVSPKDPDDAKHE